MENKTDNITLAIVLALSIGSLLCILGVKDVVNKEGFEQNKNKKDVVLFAKEKENYNMRMTYDTAFDLNKKRVPDYLGSYEQATNNFRYPPL